jgi:hypothetical protein
MTTRGRVLLAIEAAASVTVAQMAIMILEPARLMRILGYARAPDGIPAAPVVGQRSARSVVRAVERVADLLPWRPLCLPRAVAARAMLRRRGIPCQLHLGIVAAAPVSAHAWLTVGGHVVQGGPVRRITPLATLH